MKSMNRLVGVIALVTIVGFSIVACGGGKSAFAGTWFLVEGSGSNMPSKCELLRDGAGFALNQAITWKTENNRFYLIHPDIAMAFDYKISGSKLDLTNDRGQKFTYVKELGGASEIVGTWFLMERSGNNLPLKWELLRDGTGLAGNSEIIWKTENNRLYIPSFAIAIDYKISGSKLELNNDESKKIVYVKELGGASEIVGTWFLFLVEGNFNSLPLKFELLRDGTVAGNRERIWKTENNRLYIPSFAMAVDYKISGSKLELNNDEGKKIVYVKELGGNSAIIGSWTDVERNGWVFNSNGELSYENGSKLAIRNYQFIVDGNKLVIHIENRLQTYDISISADERTVALTGGNNFGTWRVAGPGWSVNTLKK